MRKNIKPVMTDLWQQRGRNNRRPGPDSNFSIWSAGGYIFGYDEIDITMEVEETPEAREATIAWETRQLGIMDWITNDVDWMTKRSTSVKCTSCMA